MRLLLNGGAWPGAIASEWLGGLITPRSNESPRRWLRRGCPWAMDNNAYGAWDAAAFWHCLVRHRATPGCLWVVVPDVVGDHAATLRRFGAWAWLVRALRYPVAFAAQDGATPNTVPWYRIAGLFIGGSTAWKLGPAALACIRAAQDRGRWVHMGRVNTRPRLRYAGAIGCDSVDGSGMSRWATRDGGWCVAYARHTQAPFAGMFEHTAQGETT